MAQQFLGSLEMRSVALVKANSKGRRKTGGGGRLSTVDDSKNVVLWTFRTFIAIIIQKKLCGVESLMGLDWRRLKRQFF